MVKSNPKWGIWGWDAHWTWTQSTKAGLWSSTLPHNHTTTTNADE